MSSTTGTRSRWPAVVLARLATVLTATLLLGLAATGPADAAPSLSVTPKDGLSPTGATSVQVRGSGYDASKGIYVAYCVVPAPGQVPSPCGGGADMTGTSGGSVWFSNDPPPYGEGLAKPYDGSFSATVQVTPTIGDIDCTRTRCAVVTRNDHTRNSDRSQDVIVPVSFADPEPAPTKEPTPAPTKEPTPAPTKEPTSTPTRRPTPAATPSATPTTPSDTASASRGERADGEEAPTAEDPTADTDEDTDDGTGDDAADAADTDGADATRDEDDSAAGDEPSDDEVDSDVEDSVVAIGTTDDGSSGRTALWVAAGSVVAVGAGVGTFIVRRRRAAAP